MKNKRIIKSYLLHCLSLVIVCDRGVAAKYIYDSGWDFDTQALDDALGDIEDEMYRRGEAWRKYSGVTDKI